MGVELWNWTHYKTEKEKKPKYTGVLPLILSITTEFQTLTLTNFSCKTKCQAELWSKVRGPLSFPWKQLFFYISLIILVIIFSKQQLHDCVHVTHLVDRLINLFIYTVLLFCFGLFFVVVFTALKHCRPSQGHPSIHYPSNNLQQSRFDLTQLCYHSTGFKFLILTRCYWWSVTSKALKPALLLCHYFAKVTNFIYKFNTCRISFPYLASRNLTSVGN